MVKQQSSPETVATIRVSQVICDWQAGPVRCTAHLASGGMKDGVKAIWRNEVGTAHSTPAGTTAAWTNTQ